jgi:hypothetical protein
MRCIAIPGVAEVVEGWRLPSTTLSLSNSYIFLKCFYFKYSSPGPGRSTENTVWELGGALTGALMGPMTGTMSMTDMTGSDPALTGCTLYEIGAVARDGHDGL